MIARACRLVLLVVLTLAILASCSSGTDSGSHSGSIVGAGRLRRARSGDRGGDLHQLDCPGQCAGGAGQRGRGDQDQPLSPWVHGAGHDPCLVSHQERCRDLGRHCDLRGHPGQSRPDAEGAAAAAPRIHVRCGGRRHPAPADDDDRRVPRPGRAVRDREENLRFAERPGGDPLKEGLEVPAGTQFLYSNLSSHLVAAVPATALRRTEGDHPRSLLEYARVRLFEPLGIDTIRRG